MNIKKTHKNMYLLTPIAMAMLSAGQLYAQDDELSEKEYVQNAGYLGTLSQQAIASGNVERLQSSEIADDFNLATGVDAADLKTRVDFWHHITLDTVALDHTPIDGAAPTNNAGPTRTTRALAMIHIAMFEALNHLDDDYESYIGDIDFNDGGGISEDAAVASAAFSSLSVLYPSQADRLQTLYDADIALISESDQNQSVQQGILLGQLVSEIIADGRELDGSEISEPSFGEGGAVADGNITFFNTEVNGGSEGIGEWTPDPNTPDFSGDYNLSLGAYWGAVSPFFLDSGDQYRSEAPPLPGDEEYSAAYNEVIGLGGSPENVNTVSTGTDETHFIGNYWGYDGVPLLGVPPRIYNQIGSQIAAEEIDDALDYARFLAMLNVALADTAIAAWDSKYYYNFWRPVTGTRVDDGDDNTATDELWDPVGVSVINTEEAIRVTPPFPAYPSGHAAFGATLFVYSGRNTE